MGEFAQIKGMRRDSGPQAQSVDAVCAVSHDRAVVRHSEQAGRFVPCKFHRGAAQLDRRVQRYDVDFVRPRNLPRVGLKKPTVRLLDLKTIANRLAEYAVFVAEAVADGRILKRRQGIDETCRQPAEASIAEPRVRLFL